MLVEIREGGDGVSCWNADAIGAYAASITEREAILTAGNPDVRVTPGLIKCYGCEVMEYDMGTRCTAMLTRTLYAVADEIAPRADDAKGSLTEIPGLVSRLETEGANASTASAYTGAPPAATEAARPRGLRGLLGRRG